MEKKNFITLILGVIGGMLFALGMCMCLLPEWGTFNQGIVVGAVGIVELIITWIVYRKLSGKQGIKLNAKIIGRVIYGIIAAIIFGVGMCMTMVFDGMMIPGIIVGIAGIILLLFLIPLCGGLKDSKRK